MTTSILNLVGQFSPCNVAKYVIKPDKIVGCEEQCKEIKYEPCLPR